MIVEINENKKSKFKVGELGQEAFEYCFFVTAVLDDGRLEVVKFGDGVLTKGIIIEGEWTHKKKFPCRVPREIKLKKSYMVNSLEYIIFSEISGTNEVFIFFKSFARSFPEIALVVGYDSEDFKGTITLKNED